MALPGDVFAQTLTFSQNTLNTSVNQTHQVFIKLDPRGSSILGVDLILNFDPQHIKVVDIVSTGAFNESAGKSIDNINGEVKFAVFAQEGEHINTLTDIVALSIKPKTSSTTEISFLFKEGSTVDTNTTSVNGADLLEEVGSLVVVSHQNEGSSENDQNSISQISNDVPDNQVLPEAGPTIVRRIVDLIENAGEFVLGKSDDRNQISDSTLNEIENPNNAQQNHVTADNNNSFLGSAIFVLFGLVLGIVAALLLPIIRQRLR